jgi:hypothetical protein
MHSENETEVEVWSVSAERTTVGVELCVSSPASVQYGNRSADCDILTMSLPHFI